MPRSVPDREQRIRLRAYFLWQAAGCPEGAAEEHWRQASALEQEAADRQADAAGEASFPASDPPSYSGITGIGRRG